MRTLITAALFISLTGIVGGCSHMHSKSGSMQDGTKFVVMRSGGANVLKLTPASDVKWVASDGKLHFTGPDYEVEFWVLSDAKTIDEGVAQAGAKIVDEFKDFNAEHTADLTVAGSPAKQLIGTGHEADDGDPGDADLMVFMVGDHVFVGCNHGESLTPAGQQGLMTLVQTAKVP